MTPGILTLGSLSQVTEDPAVEIPRFKPATTVPWLVSLPAPILYGVIAKAVAGPIDKKTPETDIRVRNGISAAVLGISTFFSWRAALDPGVFTGLRIAAGITGTIWGLTGILALASTFATGPFVRSETEFQRVQQYLRREHAKA